MGVNSFFFFKIHYCLCVLLSLSLSLSRIHECTYNLFLPYYSPVIYTQTPMLDYCLYSCFLKSNSSCSGVSQGGPRRLFVLLQETLFKCPFLISSIINSITRRVLAFSMLILSKRPNLSASSYKENADSSTHRESQGLNKQSANM